jgi:hypothetical protein
MTKENYKTINQDNRPMAMIQNGKFQNIRHYHCASLHSLVVRFLSPKLSKIQELKDDVSTG